MTEQKDYTLVLDPGDKIRYNAGAYDYQKCEPTYEIEILVPKDELYLVEVNHILIGSPDSCQWGWDINNKSSSLAFIKVTQDGNLVRYS